MSQALYTKQLKVREKAEAVFFIQFSYVAFCLSSQCLPDIPDIPDMPDIPDIPDIHKHTYHTRAYIPYLSIHTIAVVGVSVRFTLLICSLFGMSSFKSECTPFYIQYFFHNLF